MQASPDGETEGGGSTEHRQQRHLGRQLAIRGTALACLVVVGRLVELHPVYWLGCATIGAVLLWQHRVVRPEDLSRVGMAFLNLNATISVLYLVTVLLSILLR